MEEKKNEKVTLSGLEKKIDELIGSYNEALKGNDASAPSRIEGELKEVEEQYADLMQMEVFEKLSKKENPIVEAVTLYRFPVVGHKLAKARKEGAIPEIEKAVKDKQIDLLAFCKKINAPVDWRYKVEKFNQLLCMRTAIELGTSKEKIESIGNSFYMNELAEKINLGGTPTSNNQIVKMLQTILDDIFVKDEGKYKANSHDAAYLVKCYTRRGKEPLTVAVAKNSYMFRLITDICHRSVTGKVYSVDFKMKKKEEKPAEVSEKKIVEKKPAEVSKKKTKAEAVA